VLSGSARLTLWQATAATRSESPGLRPRTKPAQWFTPRRLSCSLTTILGNLTDDRRKMSGHLLEGKSRGHLLASMRRGVQVCASSHRCMPHAARSFNVVVCRTAGLASRAENRQSCAMLRCESQLRHGLRRLCIPCRRVVGSYLLGAFLLAVAMDRRLICFPDSGAAYSHVTKWIRRLHEWRRLLTAVHICPILHFERASRGL
jgi:hypothetical protein